MGMIGYILPTALIEASLTYLLDRVKRPIGLRTAVAWGACCPRCRGELIVLTLTDRVTILPMDVTPRIILGHMPMLVLHLCPDHEADAIYAGVRDALDSPEAPVLALTLVAVLDAMLAPVGRPSPDAEALADDPVLGSALSRWPLNGDGAEAVSLP